MKASTTLYMNQIKKQNQFKLTAADIITLRETSSLLNH